MLVEEGGVREVLIDWQMDTGKDKMCCQSQECRKKQNECAHKYDRWSVKLVFSVINVTQSVSILRIYV